MDKFNRLWQAYISPEHSNYLFPMVVKTTVVVHEFADHSTKEETLLQESEASWRNDSRVQHVELYM